VFFPWDSGTIILERRSRMRELRSRHRNKRKLASFAGYPGCAPARLIRGSRGSAPSRLESRRTQSGEGSRPRDPFWRSDRSRTLPALEISKERSLNRRQQRNQNRVLVVVLVLADFVGALTRVSSPQELQFSGFLIQLLIYHPTPQSTTRTILIVGGPADI
jgi:hypothetical protein